MLGLKEAVQLAAESGARLRLVHVVDQSVLTLNPEAVSGGTVFINALSDSGKLILRNARALAERHGIKPESVMYENFTGRIAEVILADARKWRADLIVMGTHGRRGLSHVLLGSDAETVVRSSPVPVLLVRGKPGKQPRKRPARRR